MFWIYLAGISVVVVVIVCWLLVRNFGPKEQFRIAQSRFENNQSELQEQFFQTAAASGKPKGLKWEHCDWEPLLSYARDLRTMQIVALQGISLKFSAIAGGDMEDVEAVNDYKTATAVFIFDGIQWQTLGQTVFNMNPDEALEHFQPHYQKLEQTSAASS